MHADARNNLQDEQTYTKYRELFLGFFVSDAGIQRGYLSGQSSFNKELPSLFAGTSGRFRTSIHPLDDKHLFRLLSFLVCHVPPYRAAAQGKGRSFFLCQSSREKRLFFHFSAFPHGNRTTGGKRNDSMGQSHAVFVLD